MGQKEFIIRRCFTIILCWWIIITLLFCLFRMLPGDPTITLLDPSATEGDRAYIREIYGLDKPQYVQYVIYVKKLIKGDFGKSFVYGKPVLGVIADKFWNTIVLMFSYGLFAYVLGLLGGMLFAWKRGTAFEKTGLFVVLVLRCAPVFWTSMLAVIIFAQKLGWFPLSGMRSVGYSADTVFQKFLSFDFLWHLALPVLVSGLYFLSMPLLLLRNSMLEVIREDYVEIARAKGLSEFKVMLKHCARNAVLPVVTDAALFIGWAMAGQVVLEYAFSWPGLGNEIVFATMRHDYPLAQGAFFIIAMTVTIMNFIADLTYGYLDPRIVYK
jgi:peptide/nickel transport system permease protein